MSFIPNLFLCFINSNSFGYSMIKAILKGNSFGGFFVVVNIEKT